MPILNFSPEFVDLVASRKKCQTIRRTGSRFKIGDDLDIYTGIGTKFSRPITKTHAIVTKVSQIHIWPRRVSINGVFSFEDAEEFAIKDGFTSFAKMREWLEQNYKLKKNDVFEGVLIEWRWPETEVIHG